MLLGDKSAAPSTPPRPPPAPARPVYKNKHTQRGGGWGGCLPPPARRSQRGLLIVTCARSAPSQSPVSQMHAGRSAATAVAAPPRFDSSRSAGRSAGVTMEGRGRGGGEKQLGVGVNPDPAPPPDLFAQSSLQGERSRLRPLASV